MSKAKKHGTGQTKPKGQRAQGRAKKQTPAAPPVDPPKPGTIKQCNLYTGDGYGDEFN